MLSAAILSRLATMLLQFLSQRLCVPLQPAHFHFVLNRINAVEKSLHIVNFIVLDSQTTSAFHIVFDLASNIRKHCISRLGASDASIDLVGVILLVPYGRKGSYAL